MPPGWVLAIDTSGARTAVALLRPGAGPGAEIVRLDTTPRGHADRLFGLIDDALDAAGVGMSAVGRIVVCTGPGVFTGLRIGIAAARGLSLGCGVAAVGVSRFEALAAQAGGTGRIGVCLAGPAGTHAAQNFDAGRALGPPRLDVAGAWVPEPGTTRVAGDGVPSGLGLVHLAADGVVDPVLLARLGAARGPGERPAPIYARGPDADLPRDPAPVILEP